MKKSIIKKLKQLNMDKSLIQKNKCILDQNYQIKACINISINARL